MTGRFKRLFLVCAATLALCGTAQAQWSIGKPGNRAAPQGQARYAFLVHADPLPGRQIDFDEAYQNMHMGDLVQLPGWTGAQRFRLVMDAPHTINPLFKRGSLIIWDWEGADQGKLVSDERAAISGGKSRRIPGFDYSGGGSVSTTYQVIGPRVTRPDGKKAFMPAYDDNKTPRPNRYILMEYMDPPAGVSDGDFESAISRRVNEVLAVPGWMAVQRFRLAPPIPGSAPARLAWPKYLLIWETEGTTAQGNADALAAATKAGQVKDVAANAGTAQFSWWVPTSPFIDKDDFER